MGFADENVREIPSPERGARTASHSRSVSMILGGSGIAIALLILIASAFLIMEARRDVVDQWRVSLLRFTRVLAGHADQSFRSADLVLNAVREDLADIRFDTAESLRLLDRERLLPALNLRANASEQIASISIYDTGGGLLIEFDGGADRARPSNRPFRRERVPRREG